MTSAFDNTGIDDLFRSVGNLFLDPNYQDIIEKNKIEKENTQGNTIKLDKDEVAKVIPLFLKRDKIYIFFWGLIFFYRNYYLNETI